MASTSTKTKKKYTEKELLKGLEDHFGFDDFKGNQKDIIKSIMGGNDTFVIMPTGGGKSLCYQLPALMLDGICIVISPLIALMKNQVDLIRGYCDDDDIAHFLNSSLNKGEQKKVKDDLTSGITKILYVAPETLTKEENVAFFSTLPIDFIAVDEAHCISEWGHDFRPEYRKIRQVIDEINPNIPVIALTATATPKVQDDIVKNLGFEKHKTFISSFNRPNLYYEIQPKPNEKSAIKSITKFISKHKGKSGIIYVLNRKTTESLAKVLKANGVKAVPYHAGMDSKTRALRQDQYLNEDVDVIVATIAFGMGIDKPDVRFVIHYNLPKSLENYYQETGRAGRDGLEGKCILYYSQKDLQKLEHLLKDKPFSEREMNTQLINETVHYIESGACRRKTILYYFGEEYPDEACGNCDNCINPKEKLEVSDSSKLVLQAVKDLNEQFNIAYLIDFIQGNPTSQIKTFKHNKLKSFGNGAIMEMEDNFWNSLIRQMMLEDLLYKDIEEYGLIKITKKGKEFLKKPYTIYVSLNHDYVEEDNLENEAADAEESALDEELFEQLVALRKTVADEKELPPYVIFSEASLNDMASLYPTTITELTKCYGVSGGKAKKFGKPFIELIDEYVEDNDIIKPDEFVMKSVVDKSAMKVFIIQNVDKKVPLESIANSRDIKMETLLNELETIVHSGTKLNLDYCVNEYLDEESQEELLDYLFEFDSGDPYDILDEVGDLYTYEEVQLMKIKFLNDYGI